MIWLKEKLLMREQLKDLAETKDLLDKHLKEWTRRKDDIPVDIFDATRFILETLVDSYGAVHTLYGKKHLDSCIVLARTILENSVNLKYIHQKDSERRAKNFIIFPMKLWLKRTKNLDDADAIKNSEVLLNIKRITEEYNPTGDRTDHWDGKKIRDLFDELKLTPVYTEGYSRLSGYIHPHFKKGIDMHTKRPYYDFIRKFIFKDILVVTLETLKTINEKYDLLEGVVILGDYPRKREVLFFSINNKKYGNDVGNQTTQNL